MDSHHLRSIGGRFGDRKAGGDAAPHEKSTATAPFPSAGPKGVLAASLMAADTVRHPASASRQRQEPEPQGPPISERLSSVAAASAQAVPEEVRQAGTASSVTDHGFPTATQFRAVAGHPREPLQFGRAQGPVRSKGYRAVLAALEAYERAWAKPSLAKSCAENSLEISIALEDIVGLLGNADRLSKIYLEGRTHTRKAAIHDLLWTIGREQARIEQAQGALQGAQRLPACNVATLMVLAEGGFTIAELQQRLPNQGAGCTPANAGQLMAAWRTEDMARELEAMEQIDLSGYAQTLASAGLDLNDGRLYWTYQVPITPLTVKDCLKIDSGTSRTPLPIGSGRFCTVWPIADKGSDPASGYSAWKPLARPELRVASVIDPRVRRSAIRNLSSQAMAEALGFQVIAKTRIGISGETIDTGMPGQRVLGLVMAYAPGKPAKTVARAAFAEPVVRAKITQLQVLDLINGQTDRHAGNYYIKVAEDRSTWVLGIDNDLCFGSHLLTLPDQAEVESLRTPRCPSLWREHAVAPPPVVDQETAKAVMALSPQRLRASLGSLLLRSEVEATVSRLVAMQRHIHRLQGAGRIIAPADWARQDVMRLLAPWNSYIARDSQR
jgi:hypothetical protein